MVLTLYVCKLSTAHDRTASLPTGIVTFIIGSPNFGISTQEEEKKHIIYYNIVISENENCISMFIFIFLNYKWKITDSIYILYIVQTCTFA
jgi:hypothetical protein